MVKISQEEREIMIANEDNIAKFLKDYNPTFDNDTLNEIFKKETKAKAIYYIQNDNEKQPKTLTEEFFEKHYSESLKYIKDNFFHSLQDGLWCVLCSNGHNGIIPKEYDTQTLRGVFTNYFPQELQKWFFSMYSKKYNFVLDNEKPRVFSNNGQNYLNLFNGFKFDKNEKKKVKITNANKDKVKFIWNHLLNVWCAGSVEHFTLLKHIICKMVSGKKCDVGVYLKGRQGIGKGLIMKLLRGVLGDWNCKTETNDHTFTGTFNASLIGKSLVELNEIMKDTTSSFKNLYNSLKPYITDDLISYRDLYKSPKELKNMGTFFLIGNHDIFALEKEDRRFLILDSQSELMDADYYKTLAEYIDDADVQYSFFWNCIKCYDDSVKEQVELKKLPMTETKKQMILATMDTMTLFIKAIITKEVEINETNTIKSSEFYEKYVDYIKQNTNKNNLEKHSFYQKVSAYEPDISIIHKRDKQKNVCRHFVLNIKGLLERLRKDGYIDEKFDDVESADGMAENDLIAINKKQAETIKELQKQIEELKRQLEKKPADKPKKKTTEYKFVEEMEEETDIENELNEAIEQDDIIDAPEEFFNSLKPKQTIQVKAKSKKNNKKMNDELTLDIMNE